MPSLPPNQPPITETLTIRACVFSHLSSLVNVDKASPQVVRVTITDEREVFEKHTYIWDCW